MRVDEAHKQMTIAGEFTGGITPYGYRLEKSGRFNKKDKELKKLVVDEEEAEIVKLVFDLCLNQGMVGKRIAQLLNEKKIVTKKGSVWVLGVVNNMLRNPIYKGYLSYGKTRTRGNKQGRTTPDEWLLSAKPIPELVIIDEATWDKVQLFRDGRTPSKFKVENREFGSYPMQTKSNLLFTGFIYCGHCHSSLTTGYYCNRWTTKDGVTHESPKNVYKCSGKQNGKTCEGQSTYTKESIEGAVLEEIYAYLDSLATVDVTKDIIDLQQKNLDADKKKIKDQEKICAKLAKDLETYMSEIPSSIRGESAFKPELLSSLIEKTTVELQVEKDKLMQHQAEYEKKRLEEADMVELQRLIPVWHEEFEKANKETKKILLAKIIKRITIKKTDEGVEVKVDVRINIGEFIGKKMNN